ncbi:MAG: asparagine synthase (glutamine-hydrolyzing) [Sphingomonas taxi]
MCGIAGLIGRLQDGDSERLVAMSDRIAHRGPDSLGQHVHERDGYGVLFGHRRLSIIDVRHIADQPMVDATTEVALVFNGEIYNFQALRAELEAAGHVFLTRGDSEVILRGYLAWGTAVVERLRGMFALVLHDPRDRTTLLARDGFGIKPLYYTRAKASGGERLAFASEVRALLASGLVAPRVDRAAIPRFLWNGFVAGPQSLIAGIEELPAGSYAILSPDRAAVVPVRYWHPAAARPATDLTEADAMAAIEQSVELHMQADVPLGVFLSGGIDSTAVAALAARHHPDVQTMCIGFDDRATDESVIAAEVARRIGTRHTTVTIRPEAMLAQLDTALAALDQPTMDGINSWFVSKAAVEQGWKVALSGAGGDELLGGYTAFRRLPRLSRALGATPGFARTLAARALAATRGKGFGTAAKLPDLIASGGAPVRVYQALYALFSSANIARLTGQEAEWGLSPAVLEGLAADVRGLSPLRQVSTIEDRMFLGGRLLRDMDAVSMAHSLEVRVPLVDTALNDAMARLDDAARFEPLGRKPLLRRIAVEAAGAEIFERPKQGFVFPFETWLRGPLKAEVEATLTDAGLVAAAGLRVEATTALWRAFLAQPGRIYWTRIWAVFVLIRWCAINRLPSA